MNGNAAGPFITGASGSARYDSGFNAGGRLGIQYGPLRVEEEYSYRHDGLSSFGAFYGPNTNTRFTGERHTHAIMTNFSYDFTMGWPVTPHIGFGIGALENVDSVSLNPTNLGPGTFVVRGAGGAVAAIGADTPFPATIGGTFAKGGTWHFAIRRSPVSATISIRCSPLMSIIANWRALSRRSPTKGWRPSRRSASRRALQNTRRATTRRISSPA